MMYWIVFAIFMATETFTDIFISWFGTRIGRPWVGKAHPLTAWHLPRSNPSPCFHRFPFYYEIKMAFVLWLLSPYTKGASLLYRKFVHPSLSRHEKVPLGRLRRGTEGCVCQRESPVAQVQGARDAWTLFPVPLQFCYGTALGLAFSDDTRVTFKGRHASRKLMWAWNNCRDTH